MLDTASRHLPQFCLPTMESSNQIPDSNTSNFIRQLYGLKTEVLKAKTVNETTLRLWGTILTELCGMARNIPSLHRDANIVSNISIFATLHPGSGVEESRSSARTSPPEHLETLTSEAHCQEAEAGALSDGESNDSDADGVEDPYSGFQPDHTFDETFDFEGYSQRWSAVHDSIALNTKTLMDLTRIPISSGPPMRDGYWVNARPARKCEASCPEPLKELIIAPGLVERALAIVSAKYDLNLPVDDNCITLCQAGVSLTAQIQEHSRESDVERIWLNVFGVFTAQMLNVLMERKTGEEHFFRAGCGKIVHETEGSRRAVIPDLELYGYAPIEIKTVVTLHHLFYNELFYRDGPGTRFEDLWAAILQTKSFGAAVGFNWPEVGCHLFRETQPVVQSWAQMVQKDERIGEFSSYDFSVFLYRPKHLRGVAVLSSIYAADEMTGPHQSAPLQDGISPLLAHLVMWILNVDQDLMAKFDEEIKKILDDPNTVLRTKRKTAVEFDPCIDPKTVWQLPPPEPSPSRPRRTRPRK
ncbi:hypothetical protein Hypma_016421 [Hypsizygus marmoreus]|uniref:Uncharacterized protein n=1 Tax=Hypsizygus marmoreus TaxID=39966 RepID=A0A369J6Z9_HYPMA|nr:hypothetical protein Hypma_016421 [Hypsizygus marmoreus]